MYRGFKSQCPDGLVQEDKFREIYNKFFPASSGTSAYAHYVFRAFDASRIGALSFRDLLLTMSTLMRGTPQEKLHWAFNLYDLNGDGAISRPEMTAVLASVYDLMGSETHPPFGDRNVHEHVERIFRQMDQDRDGVVSLDEFLSACMKDENVRKSLNVFNDDVGSL